MPDTFNSMFKKDRHDSVSHKPQVSTQSFIMTCRSCKDDRQVIYQLFATIATLRRLILKGSSSTISLLSSSSVSTAAAASGWSSQYWVIHLKQQQDENNGQIRHHPLFLF